MATAPKTPVGQERAAPAAVTEEVRHTNLRGKVRSFGSLVLINAVWHEGTPNFVALHYEIDGKEAVAPVRFDIHEKSIVDDVHGHPNLSVALKEHAHEILDVLAREKAFDPVHREGEHPAGEPHPTTITTDLRGKVRASGPLVLTSAVWHADTSNFVTLDYEVNGKTTNSTVRIDLNEKKVIDDVHGHPDLSYDLKQHVNEILTALEHAKAFDARAVTKDPEPTAPAALRLESGSIKELMEFMFLWNEWKGRQPKPAAHGHHDHLNDEQKAARDAREHRDEQRRRDHEPS